MRFLSAGGLLLISMEAMALDCPPSYDTLSCDSVCVHTGTSGTCDLGTADPNWSTGAGLEVRNDYDGGGVDKISIWGDRPNSSGKFCCSLSTTSSNQLCSLEIIGSDVGDSVRLTYLENTSFCDLDVEVYAGQGDDTIYGSIDETGYSEILSGEAGEDFIIGNNGDDDIRGGANNDILWGQEGADTIDGGAGADDIEGGDGDDILSGGTGPDYICGDDGDDTLNGNGGDDWMWGGAGTNTNTGGAGTDACNNPTGTCEIPIGTSCPL